MDENEPMVPAQPAGALANQPPSVDGVLADWGFGGLRTGYATSIASKTAADKQLIFQLTTQTHESLEQVVNNDLLVTNWLVSPVALTDEEKGEIKPLLLTRMVCADGKKYQTTAQAVMKVLIQYHESIARAPWNPPVRFTVRRYKSRSMRYYYTLEPVFQSEIVEAPADKAKGRHGNKP